MTTAELPAAFRWLRDVNPCPRMIAEGLKLLGTVEAAGPANNPLIMGWAKEMKLESGYSGDAVPWCGLFMAVVAQRSGKMVPGGPLWARNWLKFGRALAPLEQPSLGDVLVFGRAGTGAHVALYVAEGVDRQGRAILWCLGGNQSNAVTIAPLLAERLIGARRPIYTNQPLTVQPYLVEASGVLSTNEA